MNYIGEMIYEKLLHILFGFLDVFQKRNRFFQQIFINNETRLGIIEIK